MTFLGNLLRNWEEPFLKFEQLVESSKHQRGARLHRNLYRRIWFKKVIRISRLRKTAVTWILARIFEYFPPFFPRFWTSSIERFRFLFWYGVTPNARNLRPDSQDHFSCQARQTDGKGTIRSLDHFWKQTEFFSKNNTSKDIAIKKLNIVNVSKSSIIRKFRRKGRFSS